MPVAEALSKALDLVAALEEEMSELEEEEDEESSQEFTERYSEARDLTNYVLHHDPLDVTAGYVLGRLSIMNRRPREALPRIATYVEDPVGKSDWYARKLLGDLYLVSYPRQARGQFNEAVRLAPEEPDALIGLAEAELKLHRADEAIESAQKAILRDTESTPAYRAVLARALLLIDDRHVEAHQAAREAVTLAERKIRDNPGRVGLLREAKRHYGLLIRCLVVLLAEFPEKPEFVVQAVHAYLDQADLERLLKYHEALATLKTARTYPQLEASGDLLYEEARLNRLIGRNDKAIELIEQIPESDPRYQAARELLQIIRPVEEPGAPPPEETALNAP